MSTTKVISTKTRRLADSIARQRLGIGNDYLRPEERRAYREERAAALRSLTNGATYYTAANFPACW